MDRIWQTPVKDYQSGIWYLLRRRILTFGVLLAVAFLLLVSLTISAFISALQSLWITRSDELEMAWQAINFAVSFIIITGLFAMLFKLHRQERRCVRIWGRGSRHRHGVVGLLLGPDFSAGRRIHLALRAKIWFQESFSGSLGKG